MIKFLISFSLFFSVISCKEIHKNNISLKLNDGLKKIENTIVKKENKKQTNNIKDLKINNSIFYYLGDPYFIEGVKYIPEENYKYSEYGLSTFY